MRVVVDSNVWVSALVFGGQPEAVVRLIAAKHRLVMSGYCGRG